MWVEIFVVDGVHWKKFVELCDQIDGKLKSAEANLVKNDRYNDWQKCIPWISVLYGSFGFKNYVNVFVDRSDEIHEKGEYESSV